MLTQEQINQISQHIAAIIGIVCNQNKENQPVIKEVFASKPRRKDVIYKFSEHRAKSKSKIYNFKITQEIRQKIVEKARKIINEHPEYTQIKVISEVNKGFNYPLSYHVLRNIINWSNYIDKGGQKINELTQEMILDVLSLYRLGFITGYISVAATVDTSTVRFIIGKTQDYTISSNDMKSVYNKYFDYLSEVAKFRKVDIDSALEKCQNDVTNINYNLYTYRKDEKYVKMPSHKTQEIVELGKSILEREEISISKLIPRIVYTLKIPYGFSRMWSILYCAGLRSTKHGKECKRFSDEECKEISAMFNMGLNNDQIAVIFGACNGVINQGMKNGRFTLQTSDQEIIDTYNKFKTRIDLYVPVTPNFKLPTAI